MDLFDLNGNESSAKPLDECHRFNKTQSDSLLPAIEQGTIIFIGSTTENPFASMTPAIVSRCRVFEFKRLSIDDIRGAILKALRDKRKGLDEFNAALSIALREGVVQRLLDAGKICYSKESEQLGICDGNRRLVQNG